jgi:hypothetical protein
VNRQRGANIIQLSGVRVAALHLRCVDFHPKDESFLYPSQSDRL